MSDERDAREARAAASGATVIARSVTKTPYLSTVWESSLSHPQHVSSDGLATWRHGAFGISLAKLGSPVPHACVSKLWWWNMSSIR